MPGDAVSCTLTVSGSPFQLESLLVVGNSPGGVITIMDAHPRRAWPRSHRDRIADTATTTTATMADRQHPDGDDLVEEDDDDAQPSQQPSQRERAERAAAAAQARLRGEGFPTATTTPTTAHEAVTAALNASSAASGVGQVDEATAALAAAALAETATAGTAASTSDHPATTTATSGAALPTAAGQSQGQGNDLTKSLSEQLECRKSPRVPVPRSPSSTRLTALNMSLLILVAIGSHL